MITAETAAGKLVTNERMLTMKSRCKFYVAKVATIGWLGMNQQTPEPPRHEVITLHAVYGGLSEEDRSFAESTPSGQLEITVTNPAVVGMFKPGDEFYIDIIPVGQ
jgi:hypothetical protein